MAPIWRILLLLLVGSTAGLKFANFNARVKTRGLIATRIPAEGVIGKEVVPEKKATGATAAESTANLVKSVVGAGVLSLPAGVAAGTGLVPAIVLTCVLGAYSSYTFSLIGRICNDVGAGSFRELGEKTRGPRFAKALDLLVCTKTFICCLAYSIVIADTFSSLAGAVGIPAHIATRNNVLFSMTALVVTPLTCLKDLSAFAVTSALGTIGMIYTAAFMIFRSLDKTYTAGGKFASLVASTSTPMSLWKMSPKSLVLTGTLSTAFIAHYNAPRFYAQLQDATPKRFIKMVNNGFAISVAIFAAVMASGYATFGSACQGLILNNYAPGDPLAFAARVAVGGAIVCTYPLVFDGLRVGVLSITKREDSVKFPNARSRTHAALLTAVTALAVLVKDVGFVSSLSGALFGSILIYVVPSILYLSSRSGLEDKGSNFESLFAKFTIGVGAALTVLGTKLVLF
uniref:Amino acid transporter transmembrane domain-containing protein n=1 Tax=Octactis speculum TaxID=3111310 RepID=A0A7S2FA48_9STRA|eukprot:CAMPEP_0185777802 /NCGR_PEP_ID=MMETSP1174-20130828/90767_1 /TAXON_ID=35687 /ORGANISM="Dictyocha speculum, Strain CCMP1381" /LENGTH=456 /DNA_ID=CAMNT_0028466313 /DNA_START=42 /DNA_END=1412 /DNA_ORIENTATION=-